MYTCKFKKNHRLEFTEKNRRRDLQPSKVLLLLLNEEKSGEKIFMCVKYIQRLLKTCPSYTCT